MTVAAKRTAMTRMVMGENVEKMSDVELDTSPMKLSGSVKIVSILGQASYFLAPYTRNQTVRLGNKNWIFLAI
jgi:hypothetical protein